MRVGLKIFNDEHPLEFKNLVVCKDRDMVLDQFGEWFAGLLKQYVLGNDAQNITLNDRGGAARTVVCYSNQANQIFNDFDDVGMLVAVGTDGTAPTRADVDLITQVDADTPIGGDAAWTSALGTVTLAGSVAAGANRLIQECGLVARWQDSGSARREFLLFRDTFTTVAVALGRFSTVAYTLQL